MLALMWAGPAQATGDTTTTTVVEQTTTTEPEQTTTTTLPEQTTTTTLPEQTTTTEPEQTTTTTSGGNEQPCSASEGLTSHSAISVDKSSAHPSASASFTVKEGCQVVVFLFAGKGNGDENTELFDLAPEGDPVAGPGEHTLTVDLPDCSQFIVDLVAFPPEPEPQDGAEMLSQEKTDAVQTMTGGDQPPDDPQLEEVIDETTNCPTQTTNAEVVPSPTEGGGLPKTGSDAMPVLIAGLALLTAGAAALLAARLRGRLTK